MRNGGYGLPVAPASADQSAHRGYPLDVRSDRRSPVQTTGAEEDFAALFEQSLKSPKPGDVVTGRVVRVGRDSVTVDIGYKCEGQIPIHEFIDARRRRARCTRATTSTSTSRPPTTESGSVQLSRQKALQLVVWRDIERAFEADGAVEGTIVGKVKGGLKVDIGVAGVPAGLARRHPAGAQPRSLHRPARPLRDPQVQPLARQRRGLAPRGARARAHAAQGRDAQGARGGRHPRGHGQEHHRLRRLRRSRRHRRPAARHRHVVGARRPSVRGRERRRPA